MLTNPSSDEDQKRDIAKYAVSPAMESDEAPTDHDVVDQKDAEKPEEQGFDRRALLLQGPIQVEIEVSSGWRRTHQRGKLKIQLLAAWQENDVG
ncbi:hypothetical protein MTO96_050040 [Rhipicephalus appendiculatus]